LSFKLLILLLLASGLKADYIRWQTDFAKAHQEALKTNKSLMIFLVKEIDNKRLVKLFSAQEVVKEVNKKYVSVLIKKDQESSYPIEMLYTIEYPALFFLDKHELYMCEALRGAFSLDDLKNHLKLCD